MCCEVVDAVHLLANHFQGLPCMHVKPSWDARMFDGLSVFLLALLELHLH